MPYDSQRAVEIDIRPSDEQSSWNLGSGYRISDRLVISCAHIFQPNIRGAARQVRIRNVARQPIGRAHYCWHDDDLDLSLWALELPTQSRSRPLRPERIGLLPADADGSLRFAMFGWPELAKESDSDGVVRQGHETLGEVRLADWRSAQYATGAIPLRPDTIASSNGDSWWGGMSGAAVFCSNLLVGVQIYDPNPEAGVRIAASPIAPALADPIALSYLVAAGVECTPFELSAIERLIDLRSEEPDVPLDVIDGQPTPSTEHPQSALAQAEYDENRIIARMILAVASEKAVTQRPVPTEDQ